jgi:hypothetical protein
MVFELLGKGEVNSNMEKKPQEMPTAEDQNITTQPLSVHSEPAETPTRRELIERYGKYALVAAPLMMFASKAHAIHSHPI